MFMQKVSALLDLELVEGAAEFDMLDRFLGFSVELLCPPRLAPMDCLVQLLEDAELGTGWRAYQQIGCLLSHPSPSQSLVVLALKVSTHWSDPSTRLTQHQTSWPLERLSPENKPR